MARPVRTDGSINVTLHLDKGYRYARAQIFDGFSENGKRRYHSVRLGSVDEGGTFIPNHQYIYADEAFRSRLVFPSGWNLEKAESMIHPGPGRPASSEEDMSRLYGDIWLLEQVAKQTGLRRDLEEVFEGNKALVDDVLTLAIFPYVTGDNYNRVERWQRIVKAPSNRALSPSAITRLTQAIGEGHRMALIRQRLSRVGKSDFLALDSTTRSAYGSTLANIRWGKNKEGVKLPNTVEVVVYSLDGHEPVYYNTFPGNINDHRTVDIIRADLEHAGLAHSVTVTDRGYETIQTLELLVIKGVAFIMATKVGQRHVKDIISSLAPFTTRPEEMRYDRLTGLYHLQRRVEYEIETERKKVVKADRLMVNLYFDSLLRSEQSASLDADLYDMEEELQSVLGTVPVNGHADLRKRCRYYTLHFKPVDGSLVSYERNEKKIEAKLKTLGFFSLVTHKLDMDAMQVFATYCMRDEQEKYFNQMKSLMMANRQRNWSEDGKTGRLFILFCSLILSSKVTEVWKGSLTKTCTTSIEVLDEMRSIRCIERKGRAKQITPFVGDQLTICEAFGFEVPKGCAPGYESKKVGPRKRGRPRKPVVES